MNLKKFDFNRLYFAIFDFSVYAHAIRRVFSPDVQFFDKNVVQFVNVEFFEGRYPERRVFRIRLFRRPSRKKISRRLDFDKFAPRKKPFGDFFAAVDIADQFRVRADVIARHSDDFQSDGMRKRKTHVEIFKIRFSVLIPRNFDFFGFAREPFHLRVFFQAAENQIFRADIFISANKNNHTDIITQILSRLNTF